MEFQYRPSAVQLENTGHYIQWNVEQKEKDENLMLTNGVEWRLLQVRFHTPSEHEVRGMRFPMEIQFVHESADSYNRSYKGESLVLSLLVVEGEADENVAKFASSVPSRPGQVANINGTTIFPQDLFPDRHWYYFYQGSETEPPCLEGVTHLVFQRYITMSIEQINAFRAQYRFNAREPQELGGRLVKKYNGPNAPDYRRPSEIIELTPGPKGLLGDKGRLGPRGLQGPRGDVGPKGPIGLDGENGKDGARGPEGERGYIGLIGERGPKGQQGDKGDKGRKGLQGPAGPDAANGLDVVGPQGPQGPQGANTKGPTGPRGLKGSKGFDGEDGDAGDRGEEGPQGDSSYASGVGPKGEIGLKGDRGERGPAGDKGKPGTDGQVGPRGPIGVPGPVGPVGWRGPMRPGWTGGLKSIYQEIEAEGWCATLHQGYTFTMTKECSSTSKQTCIDVCKTKNYDAIDAIHIYQANGPFTDFEMIGLKTYVYLNAGGYSGCGPNTCCCGSALRPGYQNPPRPVVTYMSRRAGSISSDNEYKTIFSTLGVSTGYCDVNVDSATNLYNRRLCGDWGWNAWYVLHRLQFKFMPREAKNWRFRGGVDAGWGAVAVVDGKTVNNKIGTNLWWAGNWGSGGVMEIQWTNLAADVWHTVEFNSAEDCCDGSETYQFDDGSGWKDVTVENLYAACK
eukprot:comp20821_c0_seq2/m.43081 comp20821_c0_seq2/g.43081  ORF comp20821_c0_seq2/g.43081 comp20821_c0_seq2/m.43081 type:complete len:679 (-) comp20821_c0_seq2:72-2108(-)